MIGYAIPITVLSRIQKYCHGPSYNSLNSVSWFCILGVKIVFKPFFNLILLIMQSNILAAKKKSL